jgi:GWxTD domain-containing protein
MPRPFVLPIVLILALLAAPGAAPGQAKAKPASLAPRFREWLDLASYIITDNEKRVFLELGNDRERDIFIEAFWKIRDPTAGTPANEFKTEHIKRFNEANRRFRFGSVREGWRTDRGRIYIILGPPASEEHLEGSSSLCPTELWSYYGDTTKGLPTHFVLVFYQRGGAGESKLYDPFSDGPARLLLNSATSFDLTNYQAMYEKIAELQPDLALVSLSIIPGQIPYGFQPAMETQAQMAGIYDSPKRALNDSYATHFLNYKGVVSTEYLTNELECTTEAAVVYDPASGLPFCHFAMAPKRLSLDFYQPKGEYYCTFQVDVSLRVGNKIVLQYSKDFPITVPRDQLADTESLGVTIQDFFPIVEGRSTLSVLFRNTTGKEFAVLEKELDVPAGQNRLAGPIIGYRETAGRPDAFLPFQAGDKRIHVDPKMTFSAADEIRVLAQAVRVADDTKEAGAVRIRLSGSRPQSPAVKEWTLALKDQPAGPVRNLAIAFAASGLPPDYYDLTLTLVDAKGVVANTRTGHFILTPQRSISHPIAYAKTTPSAGLYLFYYMLARQYEQIGAGDRAESLYGQAYAMNPAATSSIPEYAAFLVGRGKPERALALIESVKDDPKRQLDYFHIKGRALLGLDRPAEAATALEAGNRIYDSDTALLGDLGRCYARLGRTAEAIAVLRASLKLNPDQPAIKELLEQLLKKTP